MSKFAEKGSSNEESTSWITTSLGLVIIVCVVGFIGLAQPGASRTEGKVEESLNFQLPEAPKVNDEPKVESNASSIVVPVTKQRVSTEIPLLPFPVNVLEDKGLYISLPFGGDARERCNKNCSDEAPCLQNCARLLPAEFARRILPKDLDHEKLVEESIKSCQNTSFINQIPGARRAELKTTLIPVEYYEEGEINRKIGESSHAMQNLTTNAEPDPLAVAVCYYQGSLVSALATAKAAKSTDSVSEVIYRQYEMTFVRELYKKLEEIRG